MRKHLNTRQTLRCGFTMIELIIGMSITVLVLGAVASFTFAVAAAWKANDAQSEASTVASVATARVGAMLRGVKAAGAIQPGSFDDKSADPAAVVVWVSDLNDDDAIQLSELELLYYETDNKLVCRYQRPSALVDETVAPAAFANVAMVTRLHKDFDRVPMLSRIDGLRFYRLSAGAKAGAIEAQFRVRSGKLNQVYSMVIALRSGVTDPN